ncbi:hypothetical protein BT67DRAFT_445063 [Trichocladium antarcticum]|uniref:Uncharacterized protein n=1 Tax=Trichocladium antarcticum TaxID=1450529 RepID=A0AAN6ZAQ4_9PEZI|nr:hypothetical protein BT67DRAFT_445063 [Trichocladium antarcticum]
MRHPNRNRQNGPIPSWPCSHCDEALRERCQNSGLTPPRPLLAYNGAPPTLAQRPAIFYTKHKHNGRMGRGGSIRPSPGGPGTHCRASGRMPDSDGKEEGPINPALYIPLRGLALFLASSPTLLVVESNTTDSQLACLLACLHFRSSPARVPRCAGQP